MKKRKRKKKWEEKVFHFVIIEKTIKNCKCKAKNDVKMLFLINLKVKKKYQRILDD